MKIRLDYVTNSSSSSFIICSKINMCDSLEKYMSEEYGKYGARLLKHCFFEGKDILDLIDNGSRYIGDNYFGSDDMEEIKKQVEQDPILIISLLKFISKIQRAVYSLMIVCGCSIISQSHIKQRFTAQSQIIKNFSEKIQKVY